MLPRTTTAQEVAVLRRRYPDSLVCDSCARLIATRGHAGRAYVCASCAVEAPALAKEAAKRFAVLSARGPQPKPENMLVHACAYPDERWSARRQAQFERERLLALALMGVPVAEDKPVCLVGGRHRDPAMARECPAPALPVSGAAATMSFCAHGRPTENCYPCRYETPSAGDHPAFAPASNLAPERPNDSSGLQHRVSSLASAGARLRRRGGRPRQHKSHAYRQAAYRVRQRESA